MKKIFRNQWDYVHFIGPLIWMNLEMLFVQSVLSRSYTIVEAVFVAYTFILTITAPFWWEYLDRFKVLYNEKRTAHWTWFQQIIFTSEGRSDRHDLMLGVAGLIIGTGIWVLFGI